MVLAAPESKKCLWKYYQIDLSVPNRTDTHYQTRKNNGRGVDSYYHRSRIIILHRLHHPGYFIQQNPKKIDQFIRG
tara:strand:- start:7481 stop:7708 length:228 start_codon:yes stop_codon:yes gene_type:complete